MLPSHAGISGRNSNANSLEPQCMSFILKYELLDWHMIGIVAFFSGVGSEALPFVCIAVLF